MKFFVSEGKELRRVTSLMSPKWADAHPIVRCASKDELLGKARELIASGEWLLASPKGGVGDLYNESVQVVEVSFVCPVCGGEGEEVVSTTSKWTECLHHHCIRCGEIGHNELVVSKSGGSHWVYESADGMRGGYRASRPTTVEEQVGGWGGLRLIERREVISGDDHRPIVEEKRKGRRSPVLSLRRRPLS